MARSCPAHGLEQGLLDGLDFILSDKLLQLSNTKSAAIALQKAFRNSQDHEALQSCLLGFSHTLSQELGRMPLFRVEKRGNLSIDSLVAGASAGYPAAVLALLDSSVTREIDEAGKCLAFACATACGFHILRSVEIVAKAYVYTVTGKLPKLSQRNWGEYIAQLSSAGASSDVTDVLKILKTKRNPLMHPQDSLEVEDAISIFCICQSATEATIADVRHKGLETKFPLALATLPTI